MMVVKGLKPTSRAGREFRLGSFFWPSLWRFCCLVGKDIIDEETAKSGFYNDEAGLDGPNSVRLADLLEQAMEDGLLTAFSLEEASNPHKREGEQAIRGILGFFGNRDDPPAVDEENVVRFITFLRGCGGFEIW